MALWGFGLSSGERRAEFPAEAGLEESGLDRLIRAAKVREAGKLRQEGKACKVRYGML